MPKLPAAIPALRVRFALSVLSGWVLWLLVVPLILNPRTTPRKTGIDISCHSGTVQWSEVAKQNFAFAIIKATEGVDLKDPTFDAHWRKLKSLDIRRGAYHFYVTEDDPEQQARFFIRTVSLEPGDLAPIVDIELIGHGTRGDLFLRLKRFIEILENHFRIKPIVYTSPRFWNDHFKRHLRGCPLWIAEYGVDRPSLPAGWDSWHLWQWKENARVKGIEKGADLSYLHPSPDRVREIVLPASSYDDG